MGVSQNHMKLMALTALDEVVEAARVEPVPASPALRFVLAWLYSHRIKGDRACYDEFWRLVQDDMGTSYSEQAARSMRGTNAQSILQLIARQAGVELTVDVMCQLRQARMTKAERSAYRDSAIYKFAHRFDKVGRS